MSVRSAPLDQQGLDVCLGEYTTSAGNTVNGFSLGSQLFKLPCGNIQQCSDLINKSTRATSAAAVHPHVGCLQTAGRLIVMEENHLGVLSAQLHSGADIGI